MTRQEASGREGGLISRLRSLWQKLPHDVRHGFWNMAGPGLQRAYALSQLARPSAVPPPTSSAPIVVAGLFSTANGIGEAARATWRALEAAGLDPIAVDLSVHLAMEDMDSPVPCQPMPDDKRGILILQLNAPETSSALEHLGMTRGRDWFMVGYWAWELPSFPVGWEKAFPFLSEIWAISEFTAAAIRQHANAPQIRVFPHAISPPESIAPDRERFGVPEGAFLFLTMADSMSSLERKNPFATIAVFRRAFGESRAHKLIVKTRNLDRHAEARDHLEAAIDGAANISIVDDALSEQDRWRLLKTADCLVSLHRAEGFGLTLAEAMALGKPVVCTDWSGNMDFTDASSAFLVKSRLIPCKDSYGVYVSEDAVWADADLEDAAHALKRAAGDKYLRRDVSRAGQVHMTVWANAERIGREMHARLNWLAGDHSGR